MSAFFWFASCVGAIVFAFLGNGVFVAGVTAAIGWSTNQPYCAVFTVASFFVGREKASLSNSATVWPFVNGEAGLPQVPFDAGSWEYFLASVHHVESGAPLNCWKSEWASALLFLPTRL